MAWTYPAFFEGRLGMIYFDMFDLMLKDDCSIPPNEINLKKLKENECYFVANLSKDIIIAKNDEVNKLEPKKGKLSSRDIGTCCLFDAYYGSQSGTVFTSSFVAISVHRTLFTDSKIQCDPLQENQCYFMPNFSKSIINVNMNDIFKLGILPNNSPAKENIVPSRIQIVDTINSQSSGRAPKRPINVTENKTKTPLVEQCKGMENQDRRKSYKTPVTQIIPSVQQREPTISVNERMKRHVSTNMSEVVAEREALNLLFKSAWPFMKDVGWKCEYNSFPNRIELDLETYVVPGSQVKGAIEGIDYFQTKDTFQLHLQAHACLTADWETLWPQLQQLGWKESTSSSNGNGKATQYLPPTTNGSSINKKQSDLFSQSHLVRFVHRFPYPLQNNREFQKTLLNNNWSRIPNNKSNKSNQVLYCCSEITNPLPLDTLRSKLFQEPGLLFQNLTKEERLGVTSRIRKTSIDDKDIDFEAMVGTTSKAMTTVVSTVPMAEQVDADEDADEEAEEEAGDMEMKMKMDAGAEEAQTPRRNIQRSNTVQSILKESLMMPAAQFKSEMWEELKLLGWKNVAASVKFNFNGSIYLPPWSKELFYEQGGKNDPHLMRVQRDYFLSVEEIISYVKKYGVVPTDAPLTPEEERRRVVVSIGTYNESNRQMLPTPAKSKRPVVLVPPTPDSTSSYSSSSSTDSICAYSGITLSRGDEDSCPPLSAQEALQRILSTAAHPPSEQDQLVLLDAIEWTMIRWYCTHSVTIEELPGRELQWDYTVYLPPKMKVENIKDVGLDVFWRWEDVADFLRQHGPNFSKKSVQDSETYRPSLPDADQLTSISAQIAAIAYMPYYTMSKVLPYLRMSGWTKLLVNKIIGFSAQERHTALRSDVFVPYWSILSPYNNCQGSGSRVKVEGVDYFWDETEVVMHLKKYGNNPPSRDELEALQSVSAKRSSGSDGVLSRRLTRTHSSCSTRPSSVTEGGLSDTDGSNVDEEEEEEEEDAMDISSPVSAVSVNSKDNQEELVKKVGRLLVKGANFDKIWTMLSKLGWRRVNPSSKYSEKSIYLPPWSYDVFFNQGGKTNPGLLVLKRDYFNTNEELMRYIKKYGAAPTDTAVTPEERRRGGGGGSAATTVTAPPPVKKVSQTPKKSSGNRSNGGDQGIVASASASAVKNKKRAATTTAPGHESIGNDFDGESENNNQKRRKVAATPSGKGKGKDVSKSDKEVEVTKQEQQQKLDEEDDDDEAFDRAYLAHKEEKRRAASEEAERVSRLSKDPKFDLVAPHLYHLVNDRPPRGFCRLRLDRFDEVWQVLKTFGWHWFYKQLFGCDVSVYVRGAEITPGNFRNFIENSDYFISAESLTSCIRDQLDVRGFSYSRLLFIGINTVDIYDDHETETVKGAPNKGVVTDTNTTTTNTASLGSPTNLVMRTRDPKKPLDRVEDPTESINRLVNSHPSPASASSCSSGSGSGSGSRKATRSLSIPDGNMRGNKEASTPTSSRSLKANKDASKNVARDNSKSQPGDMPAVLSSPSNQRQQSMKEANREEHNVSPSSDCYSIDSACLSFGSLPSCGFASPVANTLDGYISSAGTNSAGSGSGLQRRASARVIHRQNQEPSPSLPFMSESMQSSSNTIPQHAPETEPALLSLSSSDQIDANKVDSTEQLFLQRLANAKQTLQPGYRPSFPVGREKELELLKNKLKSVVETRRGGSIQICGAPGRGKTMTVEYAINWLKQTYAAGQNAGNSRFSQFETLFMDGTAFPSRDHFAHLQEELEAATTGAISGNGEAAARTYLSSRFLASTVIDTPSRFGGGRGGAGGKRSTASPPPLPMTVIIIDEIDKAPKAFTKSLFEMAKAVNSTLFLIGLSNFADIADMVKLSTTFSPEICVFEEYKNDALARIVDDRAPRLFSHGALKLCAAKSYKSGDVRGMLEVALRCVVITETEVTAILAARGTTSEPPDDDEAPAPSPFPADISMKTMMYVCNLADPDPQLIVNDRVSGLHTPGRALLTALVLSEPDQGRPLTVPIIHEAARSYFNEIGLVPLTQCQIRILVGHLDCCGFLYSNVKPYSKKQPHADAIVYRLSIDIKQLLKCGGELLGKVHIEKLRSALHYRGEKDAEI